MKTFDAIAAQGDFLIRKIKVLPKGANRVTPENGEIVVAHSETGHHHVISARAARAYRGPKPLVLFLVVTDPAPIRHLRTWDTHEPIQMKAPGVYEVRQQREYTPEGWQRVAD